LGRAKELKAFVQHNKVEGWVEVELFNSHGKNWVVRRLLSADANTSSWMLNGKEVLKKEVGLYHPKNIHVSPLCMLSVTQIEKLTAELHIQLDNKCQFVPQDMVVEFTKMDAAHLLEETEKAIGPKDLHASHSKLKELQKKCQTAYGSIQEKMRQRESEVSRNQLLQRDVERWHNHQMCVTQIKYLQMKKCWLMFPDELDAVKERIHECHRLLYGNR
jgi:chromosome segregation ATPase